MQYWQVQVHLDTYERKPILIANYTLHRMPRKRNLITPHEFWRNKKKT